MVNDGRRARPCISFAIPYFFCLYGSPHTRGWEKPQRDGAIFRWWNQWMYLKLPTKTPLCPLLFWKKDALTTPKLEILVPKNSLKKERTAKLSIQEPFRGIFHQPRTSSIVYFKTERLCLELLLHVEDYKRTKVCRSVGLIVWIVRTCIGNVHQLVCEIIDGNMGISSLFDWGNVLDDSCRIQISVMLFN